VSMSCMCPCPVHSKTVRSCNFFYKYNDIITAILIKYYVEVAHDKNITHYHTDSVDHSSTKTVVECVRQPA